MTLPRSGFKSGGLTTSLGADQVLYSVEAHTLDDTLTVEERHSLHHNSGASGEVILTLPSATTGDWFQFYVATAQYLRVKAAPTDNIRLGTAGVSAGGGYVRTNAQGSGLLVFALDATTWGTEITGGMWTIDA